MFNGKMKALTFSYDDGVTQDRRLVELFNQYGLKSTFNLNSGRLGMEGELIREGKWVSHVKVDPDEVASLYRGHEVAAHTLTHPSLLKCTDEEIIRQVEEDRLALSALVGYEVVGMAYPGGAPNHDAHVAEVIRQHTGIRYARTVTSTHSFAPQTDLYRFNPSIYHVKDFDLLMRLGQEFLALEPETPQIFYVWGHSYEFDYLDAWGQMEEFCARMAGHDDIFYGTNREILLAEEDT